MSNETPQDVARRWPIGTKDEIVAMGLEPENARSCSAPIKGLNMGCRFFGPRGGCKFPELFKLNSGPVGPERRGYYKIIQDTGATQSFQSECYQIMESVAERMDQAKKIGEVYSRFYVPGEKMKWRVSERLHKKRDPDCEACGKNDCNKMHMVTHEVEIAPFVRPEERFKSSVWQKEVEEGIRDSVDWDQRMGALRLKEDVPVAPPTAPQPPKPEMRKPAPQGDRPA